MRSVTQQASVIDRQPANISENTGRTSENSQELPDFRQKQVLYRPNIINLRKCIIKKTDEPSALILY